MRCEEAREVIGEAKTKELSPGVLAHLKGCVACEKHARDWRLIQAGFQAWSIEEIPEATLGFAARLVRRLGEINGATDFFERAGRRFVYAAAALTFVLMLSLAVPLSGPLRGPAVPEVYLVQSEVASLGTDPLFSEGSLENGNYVPATAGQDGDNTQQ